MSSHKIDDLVEICLVCREIVGKMPPDAVSYCQMCECIVEGNTELITIEQYMKESEDAIYK